MVDRRTSTTPAPRPAVPGRDYSTGIGSGSPGASRATSTPWSRSPARTIRTPRTATGASVSPSTTTPRKVATTGSASMSGRDGAGGQRPDPAREEHVGDRHGGDAQVQHESQAGRLRDPAQGLRGEDRQEQQAAEGEAARRDLQAAGAAVELDLRGDVVARDAQPGSEGEDQPRRAADVQVRGGQEREPHDAHGRRHEPAARWPVAEHDPAHDPREHRAAADGDERAQGDAGQADAGVSLPSALVRRRPDILAAEADLHAATAAIGVAEAARYPSLSLDASFVLTALHPEDLFQYDSSGWSVGPSITAPLFNGGALEARQRAAEAAATEADAIYRQTVLAAFVQVADLMSALSTDQALLDAQTRARVVADENARLAALAYENGAGSLIQVIDAQRQSQRAQLASIEAEALLRADMAALYVATASDWRGE